MIDYEYPEELVKKADEMVKPIDGEICKESYPPREDLPHIKINGESWPVPPSRLRLTKNGGGLDEAIRRYGDDGKVSIGPFAYPPNTFYSNKTGLIGYGEHEISPKEMANIRMRNRQKLVGDMALGILMDTKQYKDGISPALKQELRERIDEMEEKGMDIKGLTADMVVTAYYALFVADEDARVYERKQALDTLAKRIQPWDDRFLDDKKIKVKETREFEFESAAQAVELLDMLKEHIDDDIVDGEFS